MRSAVDSALRESARLKQSALERTAAEHGLSRARSTLAPTIDLQLEAATRRDRLATPGELSPEVPRDRNQYGSHLVLKQNLFAGFADVKALNYAERMLDQRDAEFAGSRAEVIRRVIELYFYIQYLQHSYSAELEVQELRAKQLKDLESRFSVGRATELDLLQARYALQSQIPEIGQWQADIELKTMELARLIGLDMAASIELTSTIEAAYEALSDDALPSLAQAYEVALQNNAQLRLIRAQHLAVQAELDRDRAKHLPRADLELTAGMDAHRREEWGERQALTYAGALRITVPLFSGLSTISESRERLARISALSLEETLTREELLLELASQYNMWRLASTQVSAEKASLALADETIVRARSLIAAGRATLDQLLDAYTEKLRANQKLAQAKYNRIQAAVAIRFLTGGLEGLMTSVD